MSSLLTCVSPFILVILQHTVPHWVSCKFRRGNSQNFYSFCSQSESVSEQTCGGGRRRKSSAEKMNQCQSAGCWSLIFKELKAKANKHLTSRRVQWQRNRKEQTPWPLLMRITLQREREGDQRETTQTLRGITKIYCVHPVSVTETNIMEVNWWLAVWTSSVTAVALNQRDLLASFPPRVCHGTTSNQTLRK